MTFQSPDNMYMVRGAWCHGSYQAPGTVHIVIKVPTDLVDFSVYHLVRVDLGSCHQTNCNAVHHVELHEASWNVATPRGKSRGLHVVERHEAPWNVTIRSGRVCSELNLKYQQRQKEQSGRP